MEQYQIIKLDNNCDYRNVEYDKNGQLQINGLTFEYQLPQNAIIIQDGQNFLIESLENVPIGSTIELLNSGIEDGTIVYTTLTEELQDNGAAEIIERGGTVCEIEEKSVVVENIDKTDPPPLHYNFSESSINGTCGPSSSQASNLEINIVCKKCKLNFDGIDDFNEHMRSHCEEPKDMKLLTKNDCEEIVNINENVDSNLNDKNIYSCALCDKKYIWHKFLVKHSKSHKVASSFICTICHERCNGLYYNHMKTHLLENVKRECGKCELNFPSLKSYKLHLKSVHMDESIEKRFKCDICDNNYRSLSYLKEHQRTHTGEKPYTCELCGKGFSRYACFADHKSTHSESKALKCPMCPKTFTQRRYLKAHILRHPKTVDLDKMFIEDYNGDIPARKFLFGGRKNQHAKPKPVEKLECPICFKEFKKMRYLKTHITRHPDEFIRRRLQIHPNLPIPALISNGAFNANNLIQNNKNSLIDFKFGFNDISKTKIDNNVSLSEDEMSSEEEEVQKDNNYITKEHPDNQYDSPADKNSIDLLTSTTQIECLLCNKLFKNLDELHDHKLLHDGEKPFKCIYCNVFFAVEGRFKNHLKEIHHQRKPREFDYEAGFGIDYNRSNAFKAKSYFNCKICGHTLPNERCLEDHDKLHKIESPLNCRECGKIFIKICDYQSHIEKHNKCVRNAVEINTLTKIITKTKSDDVKHSDVNVRVLRNRQMTRSNNTEKPLKKKQKIKVQQNQEEYLDTKSVLSNLSDSSKNIIKSRILIPTSKSEHTQKTKTIRHSTKNLKPEEKKRHKCQICNKLYTTPFYLREHLQIHSGLRPHKCEKCGKTFSTISCYREHMELHVTDKKFKCKICGVSFAVLRYLRAHVQRHNSKKLPNEGKKYECDECMKRYQSKTALNEHKKIHTGEAPFICSYCSKSFMLITSYRDHMQKHENIQMHQCPFCTKSFIKARYLQQHIVRHIHKIDNEDPTQKKQITMVETLIELVPSADGQTLVPASEFA